MLQNVQADFSVEDTNSDAYIKNKPSLATVAETGDYNDLLNKPVENAWLCFTAGEANSTVAINQHNSPISVLLEYSTDGSTWTEYTWSSGSGTVITLAEIGDYVYFRGDNSDVAFKQDSKTHKFVMSGTIYASGSIMSLVDKEAKRTDIPTNSCFANLFEGCTALKSAPELPATSLKTKCYEEMFKQTGIVNAPELPCTNTDVYAVYKNMFKGCQSLCTPPSVLPSTVVGESAYQGMFEDCGLLQNAPEIQAKSVSYYACYGMFKNCYNLVKAPELPATTVYNYSYSEMFCNCRSLVVAPSVLPTANLENAEYCYYQMFYGCTALKTVPMILATTMGSHNCQYMFRGCTSLTTVPTNMLKPVTFTKYGAYTGMFLDCSSLKNAPDLPSTTLINECYSQMFRGSGIEKCPKISATSFKGYSCQQMFYGCNNLTETPTFAPSITIEGRSFKNAFERCINLQRADLSSISTIYYESLQGAFDYCQKLKYVKVSFTDWDSNENATDGWLSSVSANGVFDCPSTLDTTTRDASHVPSGWTVTHGANAPSDDTTSTVEAMTTDIYTVCPGATETGVLTVASALTLNAMPYASTGIAYAEVVIDLASNATVTAGTNLTLVDTLTAGKRNVCVVRWSGGTAKLFKVIEEDLPQA